MYRKRSDALKPPPEMGTWGGAERVVQPTDPQVWSVFVFLEHEGREGGSSVSPEMSFKGW
jgi:hypothetical protein